MITVKPEFYDDFQCLAGQCRHSCCLGWEIDIDGDSMEYYASVDGEMGRLLRENISEDPSPHFILDAEERCPFLQEDGLCRMILTLGEDSLCEICAEHPRFYQEFPGRLEMGIGLCCEEAARLLCEGSGPLRFLEEDDGVGENFPEPELITLRRRIFSLLEDGGKTLPQRMAEALQLLDAPLPGYDLGQSAGFYLGLERLDEGWAERMKKLAENGCPPLEPTLSTLRYSRIAAYFVYRHFAQAENREDAIKRLRFAFLSTMHVCALDLLFPDGENLRMYSSEIEYSDENIPALLSIL